MTPAPRPAALAGMDVLEAAEAAGLKFVPGSADGLFLEGLGGLSPKLIEALRERRWRVQAAVTFLMKALEPAPLADAAARTARCGTPAGAALVLGAQRP